MWGTFPFGTSFSITSFPLDFSSYSWCQDKSSRDPDATSIFVKQAKSITAWKCMFQTSFSSGWVRDGAQSLRRAASGRGRADEASPASCTNARVVLRYLFDSWRVARAPRAIFYKTDFKVHSPEICLPFFLIAPMWTQKWLGEHYMKCFVFSAAALWDQEDFHLSG